MCYGFYRCSVVMRAPRPPPFELIFATRRDIALIFCLFERPREKINFKTILGSLGRFKVAGTRKNRKTHLARRSLSQHPATQGQFFLGFRQILLLSKIRCHRFLRFIKIKKLCMFEVPLSFLPKFRHVLVIFSGPEQNFKNLWQHFLA